MEAKLLCIDNIDQVIHFITSGKIVIAPCDTIYGFLGLAPDTYHQLVEIKKRQEKRFLQLISSRNISRFSPQILPKKLADFWPAPLTVVVKDYSGGTVALRYPQDEFLQSVLNGVGRSLYSTSVNISGEPPLNSFEEIVGAFGDKVAAIVNGGNLEKKAPSTVVDLTQGHPQLVREGAVSGELLWRLFD